MSCDEPTTVTKNIEFGMTKGSMVPAFVFNVPTPTVLRALFPVVALACACRSASTPVTHTDCDPSITLPAGFCAQVVDDSVGPARQIAVRSNGDVFVALLTARRDSGGVLVIRDTSGDGHADVRERIGTGATHGLVLAGDSTLYVSTADVILRYRFASGTDLKPRARVDTIVVGLPSHGLPSHTLALDLHGRLIVNVGAVSNACQLNDGQPGSPGKNPCPELETDAGIWSYPTDHTMQKASTGTRLATGLHNAIALAVNPGDTMVYAVSHGRDQLHESWPSQIDALAGATRAGEEMIRIASGHADFGWPYCYYDVIANTRVAAPEYAADPTASDRCERLIHPLMAFPAHWSPMAMVFYTGTVFPAKYRAGVFVAFHGSASRAPLPEAGYQIRFVPFQETLPRIDTELFADGFAGRIVSPEGASHRPSGMAQGKDGALYVSDDAGGRIWRIVYKGGSPPKAAR